MKAEKKARSSKKRTTTFKFGSKHHREGRGTPQKVSKKRSKKLDSCAWEVDTSKQE